MGVKKTTNQRISELQERTDLGKLQPMQSVYLCSRTKMQPDR